VEFPAVGNRNSSGTLNNNGTNGYYWASDQYNASNAYNMYFDSSNVNTGNNNKANGRSVRCVRQEFTTLKHNQGCGEGRAASLSGTAARECPVNSADYWENPKHS